MVNKEAHPPLNAYYIAQHLKSTFQDIALCGGYDVAETSAYTMITTGFPTEDYNFVFIKDPFKVPKDVIKNAGIRFFLTPITKAANENLESAWGNFSPLERCPSVKMHYHDQVASFTSTTHTSLDIRPVRNLQDMEAVGELTTICFPVGNLLDSETTGELTTPCFEECSKASTIKFLQPALLKDDPKFHMFLVWLNGAPVGMGGISIVDNIGGFYWDGILPTYRNRGIGTALTAYRLELARQWGLKIVVAQNLLPSIGYYQKLGFKPAGDITEFIYTPTC